MISDDSIKDNKIAGDESLTEKDRPFLNKYKADCQNGYDDWKQSIENSICRYGNRVIFVV